MKEQNRQKAIEIIIDEIKKTASYLCLWQSGKFHQELEKVFVNLEALKKLALEKGE